MARKQKMCKCGEVLDRPGQGMCRKCHREYMRDWRGERVYVTKEQLQKLVGRTV